MTTTQATPKASRGDARMSALRTRLRLIPLAVLFAGLAVVASSPSPAAAAGSVTTPVWVGSPFRGTYAGTAGRPASSRPGQHAPVYTVPGYSYLHDWAMDLYAPAGTAVRLYAAPKASRLAGQITAKVINVRAACRSTRVADGGYVVFVALYHSGTRVGSLAYTHVNPDFNGSGTTTSYDLNYRGSLNRWGGYIGKVGKYTRSSCWDVGTAAGQHVHLEFANVKNYSCYRSIGAGAVVAAHEYIGYLGGAYASTRNRPCPSNA